MRYCEICKTELASKEHHIIPLRFGGIDIEENKIALCSGCHGMAHRFYNDLAIKKAYSEKASFFFDCIVEAKVFRENEKMNRLKAKYPGGNIEYLETLM